MTKTKPIEEVFAEPHDVDDDTYAFPMHVIGTLMPRREELPEEYRKNWTRNEHCKMAGDWFFNGIKGITTRKGIDRYKALRHLSACLRSFQPSHEHKIGAVGWLMELWGVKLHV